MPELKASNLNATLTKKLRNVRSHLFNRTGNKSKANEAPVDDSDKPTGIPPLTPESEHATSNSVFRKKILAFRTISRMLALAQSNQVQLAPADSTSHLSEVEQVELSICSAFATVAIITCEIFSVITNRGDKDILKVIVSFHSDRPAPIKSLVPSPTNIKRKRLQFGLTTNARRNITPVSRRSQKNTVPMLHEQIKLENTEPIITNVATEAGCDLADNEVLTYASNYWSNPTLPRHLWILSKLLSLHKYPVQSLDGTPTPPHSTHIIEYVIATCYPKIIRRMKHPLSVAYIECLDGIPSFQYDSAIVHETPSKLQIRNDRRFLIEYLIPCRSLLQGLKIPNLQAQAEAAKKLQEEGKDEEANLQLYTSITATEFHQLFVAILKAFVKTLYQLPALRGSPNKPEAASTRFKHKVTVLVLHGYALQRLAKGSALRMHLKNIESLLRDKLGPKNPTIVPKNPTPAFTDQGQDNASTDQNEENASTAQEQENADLNAEFSRVEPFSSIEGVGPVPIWLSCIDWVRLAVNQFDAVDNLVKFVTGPHFTQKAISIEIVVAPPPDDAYLDWKELFTNPEIVPALYSPPPPKKSPQNPAADDKPSDVPLFEFLQGAIQKSKSARHANGSWKHHATPGTRQKAIADTRQHLIDLKNSKLAYTYPSISAAILLLDRVKRAEDGKEMVDERPIDQDIHEQITNAILVVCETVQLFTFLENHGKFEGAVHCETILASLFDETSNVSEGTKLKLKGFGPVIGVSKRCCPVCYHFLTVQLADSKHIVRGPHFNFSACTLPEWLSENNVDSLNAHFGNLLKQELMKIKQATINLRTRSNSTGSRRLSSDSTDSTSGNWVNAEAAMTKLILEGYQEEEYDEEYEEN